MEAFKDRLAQLRRTAALTQEALAARLGVTYQAVSKWETGACYPDIALLPKLAQVFGTTVDFLLAGIAPEAPAAGGPAPGPAVPEIVLPGTGDLEIRVYLDGRQVADARIAGGVTVRLVGDIDGDVACQASLQCDGDIDGDVSVAGSLECVGDIAGDVTAGCDVKCRGDIGGDVSAGADVHAGEVGGDVSAGGTVCAASIDGDVSAQAVHLCEPDGMG